MEHQVSSSFPARLGMACAATFLSAMPALAQDGNAAPVTIGMILEARPEIEPWSAGWYDSAEEMKAADPLIDVIYSYDAYDSARAEPIARQMLDMGAGVLALTTFVLTDVSIAVSQDYQNVPMSVTSFDVSREPNLSSATVNYLETGYASCWLLTKLADDGRIGVIGAVGAPFETEQLKGCRLGAAAANPDSAIVTLNTNSFTDSQANREQVQSLLDQGITEINLMSGTEDALGGLRLCESSGANCTTWGGDARRWAPRGVVTTVILDWRILLEDQVAQARSGTLAAKHYTLTFGNGGLYVPDFSQTDAVSAELQQEFAAVVSALAAGQIDLSVADE